MHHQRVLCIYIHALFYNYVYRKSQRYLFFCVHNIETISRTWLKLDYPDNITLCLHELPLIPKEPLPPNSIFNATEEREVLLEIFSSAGGPNWHNNFGWNGTIPHCRWYGVMCNTTSGRIIALSLTSNNLIGTLPSTIWKLIDLQGICFEGNPGIGGKLVDFLSPNMSRLMRLDVARASLHGEIPTETLVGLNSLVKMQLSGNQLRGVIPPSIGELSELEVLSLGENLIRGRIPESIGKLSKLWFLDLESLSSLSGTIKPFLNLSSLRFMHLSASGLHGTLPDCFGLIFSGLLECLLSGNSLHGSIPSTIGNITGLLHLNLAQNGFGGKIPKTLGQLHNLEVLDISFNYLTGFEESFIFNCSKLSLLTVATNIGLTMQLPDLLDKLKPATKSLRSLNASTCDLTGSIPNTIWSFTNLILVDVQNNSLTGTLPLPVDNMLFLMTLDFSANNLTGDIPGAYAKLLGLQTFDVSSNPGLKHGLDDFGNIPRFSKPDYSFLLRENTDDRFTCPVIRFKYNDGVINMDSSYYDRIYCGCDQDCYGYGGRCFQCMTGGTCETYNSSQLSRLSYMKINRGYWPSPSAHNTTHLVSCQKARLSNYLCSPTGQCKCWVNGTNETHPFTTCDPGCICNKGSSDRFCLKCKRNFYRRGGLFLQCPSSNSDKLEILLPVILVGVLSVVFVIWLVFFKASRKKSVAVVIIEILFVTVLHIFNFLPSWLLEINIIVWILGVVGHGRNSRGILKILIFYFQLLDAMTSNFNVWPSSILEIQRYFSNVFNFQFEGLECYFPKLLTPVGKLSSLLLLPVCMTAATSIIFFLYALFCKIFNAGPERSKKAKYFTWNMVIVFFNLLVFGSISLFGRRWRLVYASKCVD